MTIYYVYLHSVQRYTECIRNALEIVGKYTPKSPKGDLKMQSLKVNDI